VPTCPTCMTRILRESEVECCACRGVPVPTVEQPKPVTTEEAIERDAEGPDGPKAKPTR
jgi:hypothetical protein